MENVSWVLIVALAIAAVIGVGVGIVYAKRRYPVETAEIREVLGEAIARIQAELGAVADEAEVKAFAERLWDNNVGGVQRLEKYMTREHFVALAVRIVMRAIGEREMVAAAIQWSPPGG